MPWTRTGDSAATYPRLMATAGLSGADERTVNEVAGWLMRCAFQSAAHMTDYTIDMGTAWMLGGTRTEDLIKTCVKTGLLAEVRAGGMRSLKLIEDPEFIHIRLRKEIEWERVQRRDTRDPRLRVPVLLRDGDQCRYCGVVVMWRGQTSNRSGCLDHRIPGEAGTPDTMVIACMRCNSSRNDNPQWDDDHPLLPPPAAPLYGRHSAAYLTQNGHPTVENVGNPQRHATHKSADPAPQSVRPAAPAAPPGSSARVDPESGADSQPGPDETATPGSGRVGSGLALPGTAGDGSGSGDSAASTRPRRRRGRRGGKKPNPAGETR